MAKYAVSDPDDRLVWQANHDHWTELISEEMQYRTGRGSEDYHELILSFGCVDTSNSEKYGSSTSMLSLTEAFERGYQGGWR